MNSKLHCHHCPPGQSDVSTPSYLVFEAERSSSSKVVIQNNRQGAIKVGALAEAERSCRVLRVRFSHMRLASFDMSKEVVYTFSFGNSLRPCWHSHRLRLSYRKSCAF